MKKILALLLCLGLAGCAVTQRMTLEYTPVYPKNAPNNITISVKPFEDARTKKDVVGLSYGPIGNVASKAVANNSVVEWIGDALKVELQNAGYNINLDGNASNIIEGDVFDVISETTSVYYGYIKLRIILKQDNKEIFRETYFLSRKGKFNWGTTTKGHNDTLNATLQEIIQLIIRDINKKLLK